MDEKNVRKEKLEYICQIALIFVIIIASILNLSLGSGSNELWISLLSSCVGYILPNPKFKR